MKVVVVSTLTGEEWYKDHLGQICQSLLPKGRGFLAKLRLKGFENHDNHTK